MKKFIGFDEALRLTTGHINTTSPVFVPLADLTGQVLAADITARVDSPSVNASLKDGYAVHAADLRDADRGHPIPLALVGSVTAGQIPESGITPGKAVRITTGAAIPEGADAVLSEEFTEQKDKKVICYNIAETGRNVLEQGADIRAGEIVARRFETVTPAMVGLLATAGLDGAEVYKAPLVCVMATGDEVVAPGKPLPPGKLYASNISEICAWLDHYQIPSRVAFARDNIADTAAVINEWIDRVDVFVSSGGVWGSERDLMMAVLDILGWEGVYHRVKMGPGKAVAFGFLKGKPFFCLPGGPPSNEMAFLQIALPGILRMRGWINPPFPTITARLETPVSGDGTWTQFIHAELRRNREGFRVLPLKQKSRLQSMARKNSLIVIPEGQEAYKQGADVPVQVLTPDVLYEPGTVAAGSGNMAAW
ncbi:MAG: molybdopterin molybdotransferase MoeA [Thermodesulfobacteriota bacterium]|nr:molybdopterin molybdotransferase MoeA [Thermodesulfobacteriota bacterium]